MSTLKSICALLIVILTTCVILVENRSYNNGLIFYDLKTKQTLLPPTVSVSRGRRLSSIKFSDKGSIWSTFGKTCDCTGPLCGCCVGVKVKQYNFDQKMCANVSYIQPKEEINLEVFLNERQSAKYGVSARNPSPFCIPVMMGIPMSMCVQMSDIGLQGNNMNMCMDFLVQLDTAQLFEMHFQCMQMGAQGVQWVRPGGAPVIPPGQNKIKEGSYNDPVDYYDEASEEELEESANKFSNEIKTEVEEEDANKAEEKLDYSDSNENVITERNDYQQEDTKENEVILSEEKVKPVVNGILNEFETELSMDKLQNENTDISSLNGATQAIFNESDSNESMESITQQMDVALEKQNVDHVNATKTTTPETTTLKATLNNNNIIDNTLTIATIMATSSTTPLPLIAVMDVTTTSKTIAATTAASIPESVVLSTATTAIAFVENNDSDKSEENDSDYEDEESGEHHENAEENFKISEEEEREMHKNKSSDEMKKVAGLNKTLTNSSDEIASETSNDSNYSERLDTDSENEEDNEGNPKYSHGSDDSTKSQEQNDFITSTIEGTVASLNDTPFPLYDIVAADNKVYFSINTTNPQLKTQVAMLNKSDANSDVSSASVDDPTSVGSFSNSMSQDSDASAETATSLTRVRKLLTRHKQHLKHERQRGERRQHHHWH